MRSSRPTPLVFPLCWSIVALSFTISAALLNLFVPYTTSGGGLGGKFHPATWIAVMLALVVARSRRDHGAPPYTRAALAVFACLLVSLLLRGRGGMAATIMDTHVMCTVLVLGLSRLDFEHVRKIMRLFLGIALVNVVIIAAEFAASRALLPRDGFQYHFRPAGLFGHPIMAGTLLYCAMFLVSRGLIRNTWAKPVMFVLLCGIALCGVRGPLATGALIFIEYTFRPSRSGRRADDYLFRLAIIALIPVAVVAAISAGVFDRIFDTGLWDASAATRFDIFETLGLLTEAELWQGLPEYEAASTLALAVTGNPLIENAFVGMVLHAGIPSAALLATGLLLQHGPAARANAMFALMVLVVATTTLGFGTKNMIPLAITLAGYWTWRSAREKDASAHVSRSATARHDGES